MDGPSGVPRSTSAATNANPASGKAFSPAPRPSVKESFSHANSTHTVAIDPPRPPKEGCEWVWFPAGYWAEREIVELPPKEAIKLFKWRSRSGKSGSESPKNSPVTPLTTHSLTESRREKSTDYLAGRRNQARTPGSSESGDHYFPPDRTSETALPSPYLTEEALVQSLQWPSVDAITTNNNNISSITAVKSTFPITPSPLHLTSAEDDMESITIGAYTPTSSVVGTDTTADTQLQKDVADRELKPKRPLIDWRRLLLEQRSRLKKNPASSNDHQEDSRAHMQSPSLQSSAQSPLRKESTVSDRSRKSRKGRPIKLLRKVRWSRKFSSSSGTSTAKSLASSANNSMPSLSPTLTQGHERETSMSNTWASSFPGNEAMRVFTPRIMPGGKDSSPRSFFMDLTPPGTPHRPLSRQEGQANLKRTNLSTSFIPTDPRIDGEEASTPRAHAIRESTGEDEDEEEVEDVFLPLPPHHHHHRDTDDDDELTPVLSPRTHGAGYTAAARPKPVEKDWWEVAVAVPAQYSQVDKRAQFQFDLPEHLPTSPMCPANKRHKSGGTGVCVYHGRAKGVRKKSSTASGDEAGLDGDSTDEESDVWR
ncbi:hypothetical protein F4808DRAFT_218807 [Astrocystis sublimbata]|nr:hypothetical protein F4808DRAFT_218807 [Astrocystis sublimbata]